MAALKLTGVWNRITDDLIVKEGLPSVAMRLRRELIFLTLVKDSLLRRGMVLAERGLFFVPAVARDNKILDRRDRNCRMRQGRIDVDEN